MAETPKTEVEKLKKLKKKLTLKLMKLNLK